jgi:hypothetical protein
LIIAVEDRGGVKRLIAAWSTGAGPAPREKHYYYYYYYSNYLLGFSDK